MRVMESVFAHTPSLKFFWLCNIWDRERLKTLEWSLKLDGGGKKYLRPCYARFRIFLYQTEVEKGAPKGNISEWQLVHFDRWLENGAL